MGNGEKFDTDKDRWDLLPWEATRQIVLVLTYGAKKYDDNNWQLVENADKRYFAALLRHIVAWVRGEKNDPESSLPHLAHAACCILFLLWKDGYR